jgi:hypothetical protein
MKFAWGEGVSTSADQNKAENKILMSRPVSYLQCTVLHDNTCVHNVGTKIFGPTSCLAMNP